METSGSIGCMDPRNWQQIFVGRA